MIDNNALPCCGWMWNQFTVYSNRKFKFSFSVSDKFADKNWRVHPDWVYCEYNYAGSPQREFATPEDNIRHFVSRSQTRGWNWGTPSVIPLPKCTNKEQYDPNCFKCKLSLFLQFCIIPSFRVYMFFQLFEQRVYFSQINWWYKLTVFFQSWVLTYHLKHILSLIVLLVFKVTSIELQL